MEVAGAVPKSVAGPMSGAPVEPPADCLVAGRCGACRGIESTAFRAASISAGPSPRWPGLRADPPSSHTVPAPPGAGSPNAPVRCSGCPCRGRAAAGPGPVGTSSCQARNSSMNHGLRWAVTNNSTIKNWFAQARADLLLCKPDSQRPWASAGLSVLSHRGGRAKRLVGALGIWQRGGGGIHSDIKPAGPGPSPHAGGRS